ncbi:MAG: aminotransferase class IV [Acidobacteria bacterium]|nr:aminotransferase class IV [Acidobacteriota bacterium]
MHSRIILNGRLKEATRARLEAVTSASLYGRGVFTTLAVHHGEPFLWQEHWDRLALHADRLSVERSAFDEETVRASLMRLIEANEVEEGRARVTMLSNSSSGTWQLEHEGEAQTNLLIMTGAAHKSAFEEGLAMTLSPYRVNTHSPLAGVKSVNYLEQLLAREEARARDFDEAVRLNERGEVVSATMANIFWVKDGTLHTPALQTGALSGTTRAHVIVLASELSMPLIEGVYELNALSDADEIFLTSAGIGIGIVTTFDFHRYTVAVGSLALRLHEAFRQLTLQH